MDDDGFDGDDNDEHAGSWMETPTELFRRKSKRLPEVGCTPPCGVNKRAKEDYMVGYLRTFTGIF